MKGHPTQARAYVCKVPHRKAKTSASASSEYTQVFIEGHDPLLFTANEVANAIKRAGKNPEDIVQFSFVHFVEPCRKEKAPEKKGIAKLLSRIFKS
jgi:hypothetical protein